MSSTLVPGLLVLAVGVAFAAFCILRGQGAAAKTQVQGLGDGGSATEHLASAQSGSDRLDVLQTQVLWEPKPRNRPQAALEKVPSSEIHGRIHEKKVMCAILLSKCKAYSAKRHLSFVARRTSCALRCQHHKKDWLPNLNTLFEHPAAYKQKGIHTAFQRYLLAFVRNLINSRPAKVDFFVQNVLQRRAMSVATRAVSLLASAGNSSLAVARTYVENMVSNVVLSGIDEMSAPCDQTLADSGTAHMRVNLTVEWMTPAILTDLKTVIAGMLQLDKSRVIISPIMTSSSWKNFESPKYMRVVPGTCIIQVKMIQGRYDQGKADRDSGCIKAMELATSFLSGKLKTIFAGGKDIGIKSVAVAPALPQAGVVPAKKITAGSAFPTDKTCKRRVESATDETAAVFRNMARPVNGRALKGAADATNQIKKDIMAEARSISDVEARQQRQKKQGHTSTIGDAANAFSAAATAHTEPEEISTVPQPVGLNDHNFV